MNGKDFWEKLVQGKEKWVLCVLLGALVLILSWPFKTKTESEAEGAMSDKADYGYDMFSVDPIWKGSSNTEELEGRQLYCTNLENRLETALRQMRGVGEVKVVIYMDTNEEEKPVITGVLVLAQGASNESVEVRIRNSLRTLLGISERQIAVQSLEKVLVNSDAKDKSTGTKEKTP